MLVDDVGARPVEAASGPEAGAAAGRECPALVLLDLMLPGVDGLEVLRRLRADPATRAVPVVAMSAAQDGDGALAAGRDAFLRKPCDLDVVAAVAGRALLCPPAGGSPEPDRVLRAAGGARRLALQERRAACRGALAAVGRTGGAAGQTARGGVAVLEPSRPAVSNRFGAGAAVPID